MQLDDTLKSLCKLKFFSLLVYSLSVAENIVYDFSGVSQVSGIPDPLFTAHGINGHYSPQA